jgi:Holliday junction resolvasome RuvABC endonuclease subunit
MPAPCLALDPGCATGVAYRRADGQVVFRTWKLEGIGGGRLVQLEDLLTALHAAERFQRLSYEDPFYSPLKPTANRPLERMAGIIDCWCARRGIPCVAYAVGEIKAAVATGRADKRAMVERVRQLGYPVATDHEADAVAQLLLLMRGVAPKQQAQGRRQGGEATQSHARPVRPRQRRQEGGMSGPTPAMRGAEAAGRQAYLDGRGEDDCPYRDDFDGGDYWASPAGLRQCWLSGFRLAWRSHLIGLRIEATGWPLRGDDE